jgi:hypothetical protein
MSRHASSLKIAVPFAAVAFGVVACGSSASHGASSATAASSAAAAPGAPPGGMPGGTSSPKYKATGTYVLAGGTAIRANQTFIAAADDQSGVLVTNGGVLTLRNPTVKTAGGSKSSDESSFYGLDAGVLAQSGGKVRISGGSITTRGAGANGVFAYGSGASATVTGTRIKATGQYAHGAMASGGGTLKLTNLLISTKGASSAAIATDRGGGTVTVAGGTMTTSGYRSPGIYSTGAIIVTGAHMTASGAEASVVEGANSITVRNTVLKAAKQHGVMLYNSMSGDASAGTGRYTMIGGSLTAQSGPAFYVTNTRAVITLQRAAIVHAASGVLVRADNAGTGSGNTGAGTVTFTADREKLTGNLIAAGTGTITATIRDHTTLTATVVTAALKLDATSTWRATGNSTLTALSDPSISGSSITNIIGNGHTVTYAASLAANAKLADKTYKLAGGGELRPA